MNETPVATRAKLPLGTEDRLTDYAGNSYPASALDQQETPGFDTWGAKKDQAWKALGNIFQDVGREVPKKGDCVKVTQGRKHKGKTGIVFWRGRDQYAGRQYGNDMQQAMSQAMGFNDRLGIRTDAGEKFFTPLMNCEKVEGGSNE